MESFFIAAKIFAMFVLFCSILVFVNLLAKINFVARCIKPPYPSREMWPSIVQGIALSGILGFIIWLFVAYAFDHKHPAFTLLGLIIPIFGLKLVPLQHKAIIMRLRRRIGKDEFEKTVGVLLPKNVEPNVATKEFFSDCTNELGQVENEKLTLEFVGTLRRWYLAGGPWVRVTMDAKGSRIISVKKVDDFDARIKVEEKRFRQNLEIELQDDRHIKSLEPESRSTKITERCAHEWELRKTKITESVGRFKVAILILEELNFKLKNAVASEGLLWVLPFIEDLELLDLELKVERLIGRDKKSQDGKLPPHILCEDGAVRTEITYPRRIHDTPIAVFQFLSVNPSSVYEGINDAITSAFGGWAANKSTLVVRTNGRSEATINWIYEVARDVARGWFIEVGKPRIPDISLTKEMEDAINRRTIEKEELEAETTQASLLLEQALRLVGASEGTMTLDEAMRRLQIDRDKKGVREIAVTGVPRHVAEGAVGKIIDIFRK